MEVGMIGVGRMGAGMTRRLLRGGHRVVAYDRDPDALEAVTDHGAESAASLKGLVGELTPPRTVWLMVPAGEPTESSVRAVGELLEPGDIVLDGGNSNFRDALRRGEALAARGVHFLDCGTSGGIRGEREGFCLRDPELEALAGYVEDSGEGRWTVQEALDRNVPAPVINLSLLMRLRSRQRDSYGARVIAALRNQFGGHTIHPASMRTQQ